MSLDGAALSEFKELYLREYGDALSDNQTVEYGARLIHFIKAVYGKDLPKQVDIIGKKENN